MEPILYDCAALRGAVQAALARTDDVWYARTLAADLCGCILSDEEQRSVIGGAVRTAEAMARGIAAQAGARLPLQLVEMQRLNVTHIKEELREPFLYMGLYQPSDRRITLNDSTLGLIRAFITAHALEDLTPVGDVERLTMFHELFHAMEEDTPEIYTRSRMLTRKRLGHFPYRRGLGGVSEVGAVHFSKCMAGVTYSPCIFERYLLLALHHISIDF